MAKMPNLQRLRAEDVEDLAVIAALMQDSLTKIGDMAYDATEHNFMLAARRFRREAAPVEGKLTQVGSAIVFGCIKAVQHRGIDADSPGDDLTLLTIATEPGKDTLYRFTLVFDGGGEIRLESDCLHCRFEDFGEIEVSDKAPADHFDASMIEEIGDRLGPNS